MRVELNFDKSTLKEINEVSDKVMYAIANRTLSKVIDSKVTPYRKGNLERSMSEMGVRQDARGYVIGNYTDYATYVYKMGAGTNWTKVKNTPQPQWLDYIWDTQGQTIVNNCVKEYKL
jgi:hypothetical protein